MPEIPRDPGRKGKLGPFERIGIAAKLKAQGKKTAGGNENLVVFNPEKKEVYAYSMHGTAEGFRAREIFHIQKVLETLFPDHFFHIKAAFEQDKDSKTPGGTIRELVEIDPTAPYNASLYDWNWFKRNFLTKDTPGDFAKPRETLLDMEIRGIDFNPPNFGVSTAHHEVHLDTAENLAKPLYKNRLQILGLMRDRGYKNDQIASVNQNLIRLGELIEERKTENKPRPKKP